MTVAKAGKADPSRTRNRRPRGRGLRTSTGWCSRHGSITCRRRHLKCDETKPICQTCTRSNQSCVYSNVAKVRTAVPLTATASEDDPDADSDSNPLAETSLGASSDGASEQVAQRQPGIESRNTASNVPNNALNQFWEHSYGGEENQEHQNLMLRRLEHTNRLANNASGGQEMQLQGLSSTDSARDPDWFQPHHNDTQDGRNSFNIMSPVSTGALSDQPIGVATARWFGMLAEDADIPLDVNLSPTTPAADRPPHLTVDNQPGGGHGRAPGDSRYNDGTAFTTYAHAEIQQPKSAEESLWRSVIALTLKQDEEVMFHGFVTHVSQWLDLFDPYQHFTSLVPRLALHNIGLLNAILALSIRHNSLGIQPTFVREDALQYYYETLQYVRKAMQYVSYHTSLELLATTLIISAYEMLDGSSRDWERHLQGVFWIQRSQVIHGDSGGLRAAVWWAWLCQDIWAAFRDKRKVFTFWKPEKSLAELSPMHLAARSVFILGRVMNYCAQSESNDSNKDLLFKVKMAERLSGLLDEWESLLTPEFLPLPRSHSVEASSFRPIWIYPPVYAVSVQVHHASRILVLLHQPSLGGINEGMKRQSSLDKHVETICGIALVLSDYASSTLASQCVFIAGLCTYDRQRRIEILGFLEQCRLKTGWPVVSLEHDLRKYWGDPENT